MRRLYPPAKLYPFRQEFIVTIGEINMRSLSHPRQPQLLLKYSQRENFP